MFFLNMNCVCCLSICLIYLCGLDDINKKAVPSEVCQQRQDIYCPQGNIFPG